MTKDVKSTYLPLVINVTLTGRIPDDLMRQVISKQVNYILELVRVSARIYAKKRYGYIENQVKTILLTTAKKRGWHRNFISQRYIAEALRLSIHFIPFGVPFSDICLSLYGNKVKKNKEVMNNQNGYHRNTIRQYEKICKRLKGLANGLFFFGVSIIVMRAFSQVLLQFIPITGQSHEVSNLGALKSTANMLALMIPTIATHFSLKLSMCNFEGLLNSSRKC